ncbi:ParM/StbA family protein [Calothrix sp. CCY 0018]|uniref:ParM/StbA family protein n=1 Tax=Calothrix sp. CCY 0018 TaxID=3103864 RepID=UPI0039C70363
MAATKPVNTVKSDNVFSKSILSVDLGRTTTKTCVSHEPNGVVFISAYVKQIPFAQIRENVFKLTSTDPFMGLWMEHQGRGYAVGQLAADLGAVDLDVGQSKVEDSLVKVLAAAGYFKLKDEISVVISLPFFSSQQFDIEKAQLISMITGPHLMNFRGEPVYLNISKVWVMPEGYGSLLWCECQPKRPGVPEFTKTSVAIVDIGYENTSMLMMHNFRFVRNASKSEQFGTSKFYLLLASEIEGADSQSLDFIAAVHKPKGERFYMPEGAIKPTNLDDFLPNLIEMFSREICSRVLAWLPEQVTDIIITGGDGEYFWEDVQRLLKEAKINAHLAAPSRQANALGQYLYGEAHIRAALQEVHDEE